MLQIAQEALARAELRYESAVQLAMNSDRPHASAALTEAEDALALIRERHAADKTAAALEVACAAIPAPGSGSAPF